MSAATRLSSAALGQSAPLQSAAQRFRQILVRDLVALCSIGVYQHERQTPQRVRINLELSVEDNGPPLDDDLVNVVNYDTIIGAIKNELRSGHVGLVETLAERIMALCLTDQRVHTVRVQVEKLDAYKDVGSVGIVLYRDNFSRNQP